MVHSGASTMAGVELEQESPGQDWCSRLEPDNTGPCGHGKNFLGYPTGGGKLLVGLRQVA